MVKYPKNNQFKHWKRSRDNVSRKPDDDYFKNPFGFISSMFVYSSRGTKLKLLFFTFMVLVYSCFILKPLILSSSSALSFAYRSVKDVKASRCSSVSNGAICCDRTNIRTDVCIMRGDVRTDSATFSIVLYVPKTGYSPRLFSDDDVGKVISHEKIRPYTRKWEIGLMDTIDELNLIVKRDLGSKHLCEVEHNVPAVFLSTGGYTGNLYHEFNDGILPLYITSQHFDKKVVFVILEYHNWWLTKYGNILSQLSDYPAVDFSGDKRVHCFSETIVGLRIHGDLIVDASLMQGNKTIRDFHDLLDRAYRPRIRDLELDEERLTAAESPIEMKIDDKPVSSQPKLVIISRNGSRAITNEDSLVKVAEQIGFEVEVLKPQRTTELAKIYRALNSSDVMVGVHGAAMTHFLFMKPGSVFIQVIPLGTEWAAETYYGQPAVKYGLSYIGYKILPKESSLYEEYNMNDPILIDPISVNHKGWEFTKKIYLDHQTVRLDLIRFQRLLLRSYYYTIAKKNVRLRDHL